MSQCRYENFASAYLDGELSADERATFQAHLEQCSLCQAAIAQMKDIDDSLRAGSGPLRADTSGSISTAVQKKLSQTGEFARLRRRKWWRRQSDSLAAYALRLGILLLVLAGTIVAANRFAAHRPQPVGPPSAPKAIRAVPPQTPMPEEVLGRAEAVLADLVRSAGEEPGATRRIARQVLDDGLLGQLGAMQRQVLDPALKEKLSRLEAALIWVANLETDDQGAALARTIKSAELLDLTQSLRERLRNEGG